MRLTRIAVILLLWTTKSLTEATLPSISFLLPLAPPTQKVPPTHSPSVSTAPLTNSAGQHNSARSQNEFQLHKLEHSTYVSTYNNEGNRHHHNAQMVQQQDQPPIERRPDMIVETPRNFIPTEGKETVSATNHGQKSSFHQPVPLTFPPSSPSGSSSADSHSLPRIISLPPYPSQQLPQSSTYTTSGSSYSFSQGFRPNYGPPKTTKVVRHVSVFVAPPQDSYNYQNRQKIRVQGDAEKHVNIIFIKNPDQGRSDIAEVELPPRPEQKTYVYVLNKGQDGPGQVVVNTPEPPKYNPPDVYFIRYKNGQNQQGQHQQQYGTSAAPAPASQQHQPSSEYGAPSNQNFTYTLPTSLLPSSLTRVASNTTTNAGINNTVSFNLSSVGTVENINNTHANTSNQAEAHFVLHNLNYFTSQHSHKHEQNQPPYDKRMESKLGLKQHQQSHQQGLFLKTSRDISKMKDDDEEAHGKAKQHHKREHNTKMGGNPKTTSTSYPLPVTKYNTVADIISEMRLEKNGTETGNVSFGDNNTNISSIVRDDDIIVLTKHNLTSVTSGEFEEKGSPRNVSGRLDDFRTYEYAPSMGYNYFGVIGYKIV